MRGAIYVSDSGNTKIQGSEKIDATYVSISKTCSDDCPLKKKECYAQNSFAGMVTRRLNREARGRTVLQMARAEARVIDNAYRGGKVPNRDLRLHVAGESRTITGSRIINAAVGRWKIRGGRSCWSYTHAWKHVPREEWSNVSILASVTTTDEVGPARKQGYAPAIVVSEHPSEKAYTLPGCDTTWIPCPNQTRGVGCSDCQLCFRADCLFQTNRGISFSAHGIHKNSIKRRLNVIQG